MHVIGIHDVDGAFRIWAVVIQSCEQFAMEKSQDASGQFDNAATRAEVTEVALGSNDRHLSIALIEYFKNSPSFITIAGDGAESMGIHMPDFIRYPFSRGAK